ncbi:MAG: FecR domain-containing protein [Candidatus Magnetoovum sp. WYHC-5]|nr:FecR domain-containing protein [Candidatus Magnetoovum sp. WYHC-5]
MTKCIVKTVVTTIIFYLHLITVVFCEDYPIVRYKTGENDTQIFIEPGSVIDYRYDIVNNPLRIYLDLNMPNKAKYTPISVPVNDKRLLKVRTGYPTAGVIRIVLELSPEVDNYGIYTLKNPFRVVVSVSNSAKLKEDTKTKEKVSDAKVSKDKKNSNTEKPKEATKPHYLPNPAVYVSESVGSFMYVTGYVDVLRGEQLPAIGAKEGIVLFPGDLVRVKTSSKAHIILDRGTIIKLGENSRLKFTTDTDNNLAVEMVNGKAQIISLAKEGKKMTSLKIMTKTPSTIVVNKDSVFYMAINGNDTEIIVKEGHVDTVSSLKGGMPLTVKSGYATVIGRGVKPQPPRKVIGAEMQVFEAEFPDY